MKLNDTLMLLIVVPAMVSCASVDKGVAVPESRLRAEAEAVAGAFLRYVAQGGGIGCVRAEMSRSAFGNDLEFAALRQRGEGGTTPMTPEQLRSTVASQMSGWLDNAGQPLSTAEENALVDAAMEAAFSGPQLQHLTRASENWVPSSMRVDEGGGGCGVILGSPVIAGDIAFIDIGVVTIGRMHALRKIGGLWTVVASRVTWIS